MLIDTKCCGSFFILFFFFLKKSIPVIVSHHPKPLWDPFFSVHVTTDELSRKIWPAILQPYYKEDAVPDYREKKTKGKRGKN